MPDPTPPPTIPLAPLPTAWGIGEVDDGEQRAVIVQIQTPLGTLALFLDGQTATNVGRHMMAAGRNISSGLTVPNSRLVVP